MLFVKFSSQYISVSRVKAYFTVNGLLSGVIQVLVKTQSNLVDISALRVNIAIICCDTLDHYNHDNMYHGVFLALTTLKYRFNPLTAGAAYIWVFIFD